MFTQFFFILFLTVIAYYIYLYSVTLVTKNVLPLREALGHSTKVTIALVILLILALLADGHLFTGQITNYF